MLKSIKIKNFRSLKNFNMEFNQGLNVIIGKMMQERHHL
ncbi:AAA family ATPase [Methanobrevibacter ruminantium]|nr:AAA family ATPase [Methanobrevibacter ruminantium]